MKPKFEILEQRCCPSGLSQAVLNQFGAQMAQLAIAAPSLAVGESLAAAQPVLTAQQAAILAADVAAEAMYAALAAQAPVPPVVPTPVVTVLPWKVVNGPPGQSEWLVYPVQYDYGNGAVLVSGAAQEIVGSVSPGTVLPPPQSPTFKQLPDEQIQGWNGEVYTLTGRRQVDYGPYYALEFGAVLPAE